MSDLIEKLRLACDDPMWADHVEMPKKLLRHSVDYLSALKKQVEELTAERDAATISGWKAAIDCVSYAAANTYGPRVDPAAVAKARDDLVQELLTASPGDYLDCCWKDAQDAIRAEAEAAALRKALEFYADVSKYPAPLTGGMGDLWADCGRIARAALSGSGAAAPTGDAK